LDLLIIRSWQPLSISSSTITRISIVVRPGGSEFYGCWCAAFSFRIPALGDRPSVVPYSARSVRRLGKEYASAAMYIFPFHGAWRWATMSGSATMLGFSAWLRSQLNRMFVSPDGAFFVPEVTIFGGKISNSRL